MKRNNFNRAIRHLKKDLTEAPTNSTSRVYANNPAGFRLGKMDPERVFYPDIDGNFPAGIPGKAGDEIYKRPRGYWDEGPGTVAANDWQIKYDPDWTYESQSENPRETETLIDPDTGYVKGPLPPNTRSFILGPMVDSYVHVHGYDNLTRVGYIQKDTREFVLLGYVEGLWGDDDYGNPILQDGFGSASGWRTWDGQESSFTSVNSNFTFEHLQWFHNQLKSARYVANVSFFLSGGLGCILGHGGDRQPPGSTQGNTPGGGGPPGGPPNWPKNMGGENPPPNPPPYGGPPTQDPPPDDGEPQQPPGTDDPPTPPYPDPRKRKKKSGMGGDDGGDDEMESDTGDEDEKSDDPELIQDALNWMRSKMGQIFDQYIRLIPNSKIRTAAKVFADYLTARGSNVIDNKYLGQQYVDDYLRSAQYVSSGDNFVLRGNDNVIATSSPPIYNPDTGMVTIPFNYDFKTNAQEFDNSIGGVALKMIFGVLGKYAGDARVNLPGGLLTTLVSGATLGKTIEIAKMLGGARHKAGRITVSLDRLKTLNPNLASLIEYKDVPEPGVQKESVSIDRRRKILREVKQPYVMPEIKKQKYKPNFKGKYKAQNTPDVTKSKQSDDMVRAKNAAGQTWRTKDKYWGGYESTERMNVIGDRVGHGEIAFDMIVKANSKDFQKITERFKTNIKDRELQEHLNTLAHEKAMREMDALYVSPFRQKKVVQEQETIEADRDPLFAKVARKLKTEIDYSDKPSPNGFPEEPPPVLDPVTGFHPEYGKQFARYTKLDPESADAMPSTGDPDIDATVASQKTSSLKTVRSVVKKKGKPNS